MCQDKINLSKSKNTIPKRLEVISAPFYVISQNDKIFLTSFSRKVEALQYANFII